MGAASPAGLAIDRHGTRAAHANSTGKAVAQRGFQLALDVGIPKCLADLGVKEADIPLLAANALKDACGLTNPRTATQADIEGIFRGAMTA